MRWLVVGAAGMLGQDAMTLLEREGEQAVGIDREAIDITDPRSVAAAVGDVDVVLNCAAFTAVDPAEEQESLAFAVNAVGAANLARAAREREARIVQISTDYVFDGVGTVPYPADGPVAPASAYGRTKAAGEWAVRAENPDHLVVRTAWLYGAHGPCFPRTIVRVAGERGGLDVVADQVGQPTWTVDLAGLVLRLVRAAAPSGIYHGTSGGQTSWHGFAQAAVRSAGMDPEIVRETTSGEFKRAAVRPAYSVLAHDQLDAVGVAPIGPWAERWEAAAQTVLAG
ncbi:dTDP-4-dehydrorhamnose reductase [Cellulomonas soli]|uniref:dTDP-4-dehydrorhamnose reductase n=1 Tax=Cellulomonas soli TaxID=931535 RepID=UPI003F84FF25